jgi:tRNA 2-thiouridine synthesizing protein A
VSESVDARGLRCPWPVLRLAKAMRESRDVAILADDPAAPAEIAALAQAKGWEIRPIPGGFQVCRL